MQTSSLSVCVCICLSVCLCICLFLCLGRDRRYSSGGQRHRATRSSRDLLHGEDMETVMADALVSRQCSVLCEFL